MPGRSVDLLLTLLWRRPEHTQCQLTQIFPRKYAIKFENSCKIIIISRSAGPVLDMAPIFVKVPNPMLRLKTPPPYKEYTPYLIWIALAVS